MDERRIGSPTSARWVIDEIPVRDIDVSNHIWRGGGVDSSAVDDGAGGDHEDTPGENGASSPPTAYW